MKGLNFFLSIILLATFSFSALAQGDSEIISVYEGSKIIFDDNIGFETHYYLGGEKTLLTIDGKMRRQFCSAPKGVSPFEIVKNYEKAITDKGGTIIYISRDANRFTDEKTGDRVNFMSNFFTKGRVNRTNHYGYMQLPNYAGDYVVGKIATASNDIFISLASVVVEEVPYFTLVTVIAEPMDMNNVTLNVLNDGIAANGKVAIYDIFFDTGKSDLKSESLNALVIIADYLKSNLNKKYLIVGHTDNVGTFDSNIKLSTDRANSVVNELVSKYGIESGQIMGYGIGSSSPASSNSTEDGRSRNRRVELVEQ